MTNQPTSCSLPRASMCLSVCGRVIGLMSDKTDGLFQNDGQTRALRVVLRPPAVVFLGEF